MGTGEDRAFAKKSPTPAEFRDSKVYRGVHAAGYGSV